jgi:hypothetical protein
MTVPPEQQPPGPDPGYLPAAAGYLEWTLNPRVRPATARHRASHLIEPATDLAAPDPVWRRLLN